ncbi:hypothetical protein DSO57_1007963 [Entomophthora muscae]|uniref:Uncharacterized protein n=1 Tax=Entomophthora muscae TaxID=34485 RepID=A0ACC2TI41_9FUNG|nr:hypothetical protein DSO57_1007963 [Entomophthora muscae]
MGIVACLNVTEPSSTGIGGDAFCLFYSAKDKSVRAINGSGRSPQAVTLEKVLSELPQGSTQIPYNSPHAITVPGACAAMVDTVKKFGSGKLSMSDIYSRAIQLAEEGYPVSDITAHEWGKSEGLLSKACNGHEMLLNGRAPKAGEVIRLPNLAKTYRAVAEHGKDGFYKGKIAEAIVAVITSQGGVMSLEDLAAHSTEEVEAISYKFQDKVQVYECPPNGQGLTALIAMGLLDVLQEDKIIPSLEDLDPHSPAYLHLLIEVLRIAFADTRQHVTDTDFYHIPASHFLNKEYLRSRAKLFNPTTSSVDVNAGSPLNSSNTAHLAVVDEEGNACSFIMSNYNGFGSCMVPKGYGFTLQNRGCNFSLGRSHPNRIEPKKRPYHTIIPAMALMPDNELWLCFGVMGAFMQPQGQLMVLLNCLIGKMSPQRAIDHPRFCISPDDGIVLIEPGFSDETVVALQKMGHRIKVVTGYDRTVFGRGQMIQRTLQSHTDGTRSAVLTGACDPRSDGQVAGY